MMIDGRAGQVPFLELVEGKGRAMGFLKKAIGGIGLYASQKKSQSEYSGPCQMCGASGAKLFAYEGKHLCRNCLDRHINGTTNQANKSIAQLRAENKAADEKFNRIMDKVNGALASLDDAEDVDAAIERYSAAIEEAKANGINLSASHPLRLVNALIKAGKHDAAWGYLNSMTFEYPDDLWKIRKDQCRICKKEKRWGSALQFLMMSHAGKYAGFNRQAFEKDARPIAKQLSISEAELALLSDRLSMLNGSQMARDAAAVDVYRSFHADHLS